MSRARWKPLVVSPDDSLTVSRASIAQPPHLYFGFTYNPRHSSRGIPELQLNTLQAVLALLDELLSLNGRAARFTRNTPLLGAVPELDSMAVVGLITGMEERFGFMTDDDEIDGTTFATVGSLVDFVETKLHH